MLIGVRATPWRGQARTRAVAATSAAPSPPRPPSAVVIFGLAGLIALTMLGAGTALVLRRAGTREAIHQARQISVVVGRGSIQPNVTEGLADGDPAAISRFDRVVRAQVLGQPFVHVKLWTPSGKVAYSDESSLIGTTFALEADTVAAFHSGEVTADISDLSRPENVLERKYHKLLEVYQRVTTPSGRPLLFESYLAFSQVQAGGQRVFLSFAPALLIALGLLELLQLPLAGSLARRMRDGQQQREVLLSRAIEASDDERRRIAGDLHDGVVPNLAGVGYSLSALRDRLLPRLTDEEDILLNDAAVGIRQSQQDLRALFVEIYPPSLQNRGGLRTALTDLLATIGNRGIHGTLDMDHGLSLPLEVQALLFRSTREAIRNVVSHAGPCHLNVRVIRVRDLAMLDVVDDGFGFVVQDTLAAKPNGHMGLRLLNELATASGGRMTISSMPGVGTQLHLEVRIT